MSPNAQEIQSAAEALKFATERFRRLQADEAKHIYESALRSFVAKGNPRWWWEHFSSGCSVDFTNGDGWRHLAEIVPNANERVWFIAEDFVAPEYSVWEATVQDIQAVIAECYGFEFYVVQKQFHWLVGENHHDVVFAVGEEVEGRLKKYEIE